MPKNISIRIELSIEKYEQLLHDGLLGDYIIVSVKDDGVVKFSDKTKALKREADEAYQLFKESEFKDKFKHGN